jgi:hypothetical protein
MHFWGYYSKGKTDANSSTGNRLFASWLQVIQRAVDEKSRIDDCPHCNWAGAWTCSKGHHFGWIRTADVKVSGIVVGASSVAIGNAAVAVEEPKKERYLSPFSGKWV